MGDHVSNMASMSHQRSQRIGRIIRVKYAIWARKSYDPAPKIKALLETRQRQMKDARQQQRIEAFSRALGELSSGISNKEMEEIKERICHEWLTIAT